MLQVFYGSDQIKVRQQAHLAIDAVLSAGAECMRIEAEAYESGQLLALSSSVSLFAPSEVYLLEAPASNPIFQEDFMTALEVLGESAHTFIVIEGDMLVAEKKKISKHASVVEEYKKSATAKFNPFVMADALALRDKRNLWLLCQEAKQNNLAAEEIIGTFWWQLKSIRLAALTRTPEEAGMKDYPYKKAKSSLRTFPLEQVEQKSRQLLKLYHEGHRGKRDLDIALEEWVLML
jgi:hypothetical protein